MIQSVLGASIKPSINNPVTASTTATTRAVILAAGSGQRLKPLTDTVPKCLVEVAGEPILARTLSLLAQCGIREVVIVIGHLGEKVIEAIGDAYAGLNVTYVQAPNYETTNNIVSLWEARGACTEDLLLLEADVVFDLEILQRLMAQEGNAIVVAPYRDWQIGTVVRLDDCGRVTSMILGAEQDEAFDYSGVYKTVNLYKFQRRFLQETYLPAVCDAVNNGEVGSYYEAILDRLIASGEADFSAVDTGASQWYEVDDHNDLDLAEYTFQTPAQRLDRVQGLHGGYWRYGFTDHSYLYNLYFPPEEMLQQFGRDMREIVTSYPVGHGELARLVANWTGAPVEQVVVANGASELIKILGNGLASSITIPVPSFNEYENVIDPRGLNRFSLDPETFELDVEAFADAAIAAGSRAAIVVTPNNPTSLSVPRDDLLYLAERLLPHNILLMVDESFIEFSRDGLASSVQPFLAQYPNMLLIKSMSKVFGIAGLRLGYLLCADPGVVECVRRELPIWNVNGLGEAFLRFAGRYRRAFFESCERVKADRDEFYELLRAVPGIEPVKPDANFILFKLESPLLTGPDLVQRLFQSHDILIKDCAGKSMPNADRYLRVASRTSAENHRLVEALRRLD